MKILAQFEIGLVFEFEKRKAPESLRSLNF